MKEESPMQDNEVNRLYALLDLASLLAQQGEFHEIVRLITQKAAQIVRADFVLIMMLNPSTRQTVKTISVEVPEFHERRYKFLHTNISGWVTKNNRSFLSQNIQSDHRFQKNLFDNTEIKSAICIPIRMEASIIGTLLLLNKVGGEILTRDDLAIMERLADIVSPFLHNIQKIQQFFAPPLPKQALLKKYEAFGLLGRSKVFIEMLQTIEAAARSEVRILLEGESGTGKELVARSIHYTGTRHQNKFLVVDCGAIAENLIESELFGHMKGAFTGATANRTGLLEEAHGGTLFLDEIASLPLELQAKLLRVLQEGEIRPVGSNQLRKVDARIISASSMPLQELVEKQQFRADLFYRLNVYPITVPSLAHRREDIPLLANHFLGTFSHRQDKRIELFHATLLDFLVQRTWKGNIRELENFVERLVTLAPSDMKILEASILPPEFQEEMQKMRRAGRTALSPRSLSENLADYEERLLREVLQDCDWNQSRGARVLKISEHAMRYKIQKYGIKSLNNKETR